MASFDVTIDVNIFDDNNFVYILIIVEPSVVVPLKTKEGSNMGINITIDAS